MLDPLLALLTGAPLLFAQEGARVVVADANLSGAEETAQLINRNEGGQATAVQADVTKADDARRMVDTALSRYGRLDILINNAGTTLFKTIDDTTEEDWDRIVDTNLKGVFLCCKAAIPAMRQSGGGSIVNIASVAGVSASPFIGAYGISKAAMINLTVQLAHEFAPKVRVNAIAPAVVKTKFAQALYEGREAEAAAAYPLGRLGVPSDIGGAAAFLTSEQSDWITGQTLVVDGGIFLNAGVG